MTKSKDQASKLEKQIEKILSEGLPEFVDLLIRGKVTEPSVKMLRKKLLALFDSQKKDWYDREVELQGEMMKQYQDSGELDQRVTEQSCKHQWESAGYLVCMKCGIYNSKPPADIPAKEVEDKWKCGLCNGKGYVILDTKPPQAAGEDKDCFHRNTYFDSVTQTTTCMDCGQKIPTKPTSPSPQPTKPNCLGTDTSGKHNWKENKSNGFSICTKCGVSWSELVGGYPPTKPQRYIVLVGSEYTTCESVEEIIRLGLRTHDYKVFKLGPEMKLINNYELVEKQ